MNSRTRRIAALAAVLLLLNLTPVAHAAGDVPGDFEQFAFWVGKWNIQQEGAPGIATDTIKRLGNGIALLEKYRAPDGSTGTSVTVYDVATGLWTQTWSDSGGGYIQVTGGPEGDRVVLTGTSIGPDGSRVMSRLIFEKITRRTFDQIGQFSNDGGATWQVGYVTHWTRR
jgi:hypothetical protein